MANEGVTWIMRGCRQTGNKAYRERVGRVTIDSKNEGGKTPSQSLSMGIIGKTE